MTLMFDPIFCSDFTLINFQCYCTFHSSVDLQAVTDGLEERTDTLKAVSDDHDARLSTAEKNIQGNDIPSITFMN